ncbi:MAG: SDR family NAD(P)-dependent oxidoreductase [Pseudomonadales bacterium]|nr:SDR family NAD(P)-dependent oxidoreductase [Pseudomonadales bacterium]
MSSTRRLLVIGAGSGIAQAFISRHTDAGNSDIIGVSRSAAKLQAVGYSHMISDYSERSIRDIIDTLAARNWYPDTVLICNGLLHDDQIMPEKQLSAFSAAAWQAVMQAGTLIPMLWLQAVTAYLPRSQVTNIVLLSARVGSISDNRLGGWYSYRSSKAALNMLVKTAAVELRRTHPGLGLLLFHPGTTDTPLSKPFQRRVPENRLFTPTFVAEQLAALIETSVVAGDVRYLDWAGETISW